MSNSETGQGNKEDHCAQHAHTIGIIWEVTRMLSNLSLLSSGKSGTLCAQSPSHPSHLWEEGELSAPHLLINPRLEPRAFSLCTGPGAGTVAWCRVAREDGGYTQGVVGGIYPGCGGRYIPGWCIAGYTSRVVYSRVYLTGSV